MKFGELSRDEQIALVVAAYVDRKLIQRRYNEIWLDDCPLFNPDREYRIAVTRDIVNWSMINPAFKWYARDSEGACFAYTGKPMLLDDHFTGGSEFGRLDHIIGAVTVGTVDWKDSLQERPE